MTVLRWSVFSRRPVTSIFISSHKPFRIQDVAYGVPVISRPKVCDRVSSQIFRPIPRSCGIDLRLRTVRSRKC